MVSRPFREPPLHGSNRKTGTGPANSSAGASPATRARLVSWPRTLGRRHSGLAPSRQGLTSSASPTSNPPGAPSMSSTRTLPPGRGQDRRALGHPRRPSPCMTSSSAAQPHETRTTYPSTSRGTPHTLPRAVRFIWNGWDGVEHDNQARGNRAEPREDPSRGDPCREQPGEHAGRRFRLPRGRCRTVSRDALAVLRDDYPGYRIWREITPGRERYVARSLRMGLNPHTVVTADLNELRDVLEPAGNPDLLAFTTARANIARMYDRWLGGKDSFEADRAAADSVL